MQWYPAFYQLTHDFSALPFHYAELCQVIKITPSLSGQSCRLKLTNRYGKNKLVYDEIKVADNLLFKNPSYIYHHHQQQIIIPRGQVLRTDPTQMLIQEGKPVYIRMVAHHPQEYADFASTYCTGMTNAVISRKMVNDPSLNTHWRARKGWFSLESLEIQSDQPVFQVEITGDSLVETGMVTAPLIQYFNRYYPKQFIWYQTGISGNQLVTDAPVEEPIYETFGSSLLSRHDKPHPNSDLTIAIIGTNDLLLPYYSHVVAEQNITPLRLANGFQQLREECQQQESQLLTTTIAPIRMFDTPTLQPAEQIINRQRYLVNQSLRHQPGILDGDAVLTDCQTGQLKPRYDFGDHLHWSPAGGRKIAQLFIPYIEQAKRQMHEKKR